MNAPHRHQPRRRKNDRSRSPFPSRQRQPATPRADEDHPLPSASKPSTTGRRDLQPRSLAIDASIELPVVVVKSPSRQPFYYKKRIDTVAKSITPGELVEVRLRDGTHWGYGIFNPRSELALRMLPFADQPPGEQEWSELLQRAARLRTETLQLDASTDAYRVIHAEGDRLPGLVVDRYHDVLSAEAFSIGMYQRAEAILEKLGQYCGTKHWVLRCAPYSADQEGFWRETICSSECPEEVRITEAGTQFLVRFREGHKTGFFCDQRDHRLTIAKMCRGKSVLDLCCYTGGFSVQAAALGGATEVTGVDLDEEALVVARKNAQLNRTRIRFVQADAFAYMRDMQRNGKTYDVIILDPPKLIRHRGELEEGTRMHFDLNRLAMSLVNPGGVILTCTCSGLLSTESFHRLVLAATRYTTDDQTDSTDGKRMIITRPVQILGRSGAAPDHPIAIEAPETDYLKAMLLRLG